MRQPPRGDDPRKELGDTGEDWTPRYEPSKPDRCVTLPLELKETETQESPMRLGGSGGMRSSREGRGVLT